MDLQSWHQHNNHYLATSLRWLRLRLEKLAGQYPQPSASITCEQRESVPEVAAHAGKGEPALSRHWFNQRGACAPEDVRVATVAPLSETADLSEQIARAALEREEVAKTEPMPALILLSHQLHLSPFERDTLLLCIAMELDTRTGGLCARAQGDLSRPYPTFALALSIFDDPSWEALSAHRRCAMGA